MGSIPPLETILFEAGHEEFPPDTSPMRKFRRAFIHGMPLTGLEVEEHWNVSRTVLPNTVAGLRDLGYVIESTREDNREVRHRVTNPDHVPAVMVGPPAPVANGHNHPKTGAAEKIREAFEAGTVIDQAWCEAREIKMQSVRQLVTRNPEKYERVGVGKFRRRIGKAKAFNASATMREHLEAGGIIDTAWIHEQGITPSTVHTFVSNERKARGVDIETLPNGGGYRLRAGGTRAAETARRLPRGDGLPVAAHELEAPEIPPYPMLAEELQVRGVSLTDDGIIQVALRNGEYLWVAEVVGQHKLKPNPHK